MSKVNRRSSQFKGLCIVFDMEISTGDGAKKSKIVLFTCNYSLVHLETTNFLYSNIDTNVCER